MILLSFFEYESISSQARQNAKRGLRAVPMAPREVKL